MSFWQFFRFVFVVFSLYLLGDAFARWDGFSYYAPFTEFIPSFSLALILWSMAALISAAILWLLFRLSIWTAGKLGLIIRMDHVLLNTCLFLVSGFLFWKSKRIIWPDIQTSLLVKLAVLSAAVFISMYLTWLLRGRSASLVGFLRERITPLVWIFGLLLCISFPVVTYQTWIKVEDTIPVTAVQSDENRPNIILVTFDALAAREMSLYGYPLNTTPFIDKWAENATVFTRAKSASNFTTPAAASLMTGKRVWTHRSYHIAGSKPWNSQLESLPAKLKEKGYFNLAFVANPFASTGVLGISNSFDIAPLTSELGSSDALFGWKFGIVDRMLYKAFAGRIRMHDWILKNEFIFSKVLNLISRNITQTPVPPNKTFDMFLNYLDAGIPEPYFVWIHIFPPHDPYLPPEPFIDRDIDGSLRSYKGQEKLIEESYKYLFAYRTVPEEMLPAVELMRNYYDEFIKYCDIQFEEFIEEFNKRGSGDTIILLSSDHGESFDHGYFTHGGPFLYEQVTHIPLIVKEPDQLKGLIVDSLVEQVDISASILDLANISVPEWMDGRSLVRLMRGGMLPERPAFSMNFEKNRSLGNPIITGSAAVWSGDYKLIHYLERDESLLFNISKDPRERYDLTEKEPRKFHDMLSLLKHNLENANRKIAATDD